MPDWRRSRAIISRGNSSSSNYLDQQSVKWRTMCNINSAAGIDIPEETTGGL